MDHDARCDAHDAALAVIREITHDSVTFERSATIAAEKVAVGLASNSATLTAHSLEFIRIQGDLKLLCERIPSNLVERFTQSNAKLDTLHADFTMLRRQVYAVIGSILMIGLAAFMKFVLSGGLTK